jgi:signal transduction histidine kinase
LGPVNVAELTSRSVEAMRPTADDKGVTLEVVTNHPPIVRGDHNRLTQVLDNLVSNAVKFTNDGGAVNVSVSAENGNVRLVVADTGIGVPLEEQGQVFSRFFRASTATRLAIPGPGLGLAISRALVEQHGGTITFESQEGEGTQVVVILPAA